MNMSKWKDAVGIYNQQREQLRDDRVIIQDRIMSHLRNFFEWDDIRFNEDFSKIVLVYSPNKQTLIRDNIGELEMEWIITYDYDGRANTIICIELYPFGVENSS